MSELGYLFHDKSSLHIVAWDLDVKRSRTEMLPVEHGVVDWERDAFPAPLQGASGIDARFLIQI